MPSTLSAAGTGHASATPDVIHASYRLSAYGASSELATEALQDLASKMVRALLTLGLPESALRRTGVSVVPHVEWREQRQETDGYHARDTLTAQLRRDPGAVARLLDVVGLAGPGEVEFSVRHELSEPADLVHRALQQAVAEARKRAEIMATAAGVTLGKLVRLEDDATRDHQRHFEAVSSRSGRLEDAAVRELDPTDVEEAVTVFATWAID